jgi:hypothetical protein
MASFLARARAIRASRFAFAAPAFAQAPAARSGQSHRSISSRASTLGMTRPIEMRTPSGSKTSR